VITTDLTKWINIKEVDKHLVIFRKDLPEVMVTDKQTFGPIQRNTVLLTTDIPKNLLKVLYSHGIVEDMEGGHQ